jgi:hypothetical protein
LKKNIEPMLGSALGRINSLRPVTFDWIEDDPDVFKPHAGFIAQEVETVMPGIVKILPYTYKKDGVEVLLQDAKHLNFSSEMYAHLVKAVQELSSENDVLKAKLAGGYPGEVLQDSDGLGTPEVLSSGDLVLVYDGDGNLVWKAVP